MAINKEKNVMLQITMPKEDYEQLVSLQNAFIKNGIKTSKSEILTKALEEYIKILVYCDRASQQKQQESNKEDKKDA